MAVYYTLMIFCSWEIMKSRASSGYPYCKCNFHKDGLQITSWKQLSLLLWHNWFPCFKVTSHQPGCLLQCRHNVLMCYGGVLLRKFILSLCAGVYVFIQFPLSSKMSNRCWGVEWSHSLKVLKYAKNVSRDTIAPQTLKKILSKIINMKRFLA